MWVALTYTQGRQKLENHEFYSQISWKKERFSPLLQVLELVQDDVCPGKGKEGRKKMNIMEKKKKRVQILELSKWVQSQLYQPLVFDLKHIVYPFFLFCLSVLICKVDTIRVSTCSHQSTVYASFPWKHTQYRCLPTVNISSSYRLMRVSYISRRALLQVVIRGSSCAHHLVLLLCNSWPWNPGWKNMGKAGQTLSTSAWSETHCPTPFRMRCVTDQTQGAGRCGGGDGEPLESLPGCLTWLLWLNQLTCVQSLKTLSSME